MFVPVASPDLRILMATASAIMRLTKSKDFHIVQCHTSNVIRIVISDLFVLQALLPADLRDKLQILKQQQTSTKMEHVLVPPASSLISFLNSPLFNLRLCCNADLFNRGVALSVLLLILLSSSVQSVFPRAIFDGTAVQLCKSSTMRPSLRPS